MSWEKKNISICTLQEKTFFCGISRTNNYHLLSKYKDSNNYWKSQVPVTDSYKLNPNKVLDVVIS